MSLELDVTEIKRLVEDKGLFKPATPEQVSNRKGTDPLTKKLPVGAQVLTPDEGWAGWVVVSNDDTIQISWKHRISHKRAVMDCYVDIDRAFLEELKVVSD